jgi:hypothetical protein
MPFIDGSSYMKGTFYIQPEGLLERKSTFKLPFPSTAERKSVFKNFVPVDYKSIFVSKVERYPTRLSKFRLPEFIFGSDITRKSVFSSIAIQSAIRNSSFIVLNTSTKKRKSKFIVFSTVNKSRKTSFTVTE